MSGYLVNSRWFYILLANVAVLSANIWLFVDKSQPAIDSDSSIASPVSKNKSPATGISAMDSFSFALNDPLAVQTQDLSPELSNAQKEIQQNNKTIENTQHQNRLQAQRITSLEKRNTQLQSEVRWLGAELDDHTYQLANKSKEIELLEKAQKTQQPSPFTSDVELVKKSIDSYPDLIKAKPATVQTETIPEETVSTSNEIETKHFSGSVEFGFAYEQDNQVTKAVNGRLILDYDEPDEYNLNSDLEFEFENEDGESSTDKYRWQLQSDYNLDPQNLMFARSDLNRSKFSSYEQEDIFTVGYGRIFLNNERHKLNIELGPGYRFAIPNIGEDAVSVDEFIVRTRLNYERIITDSLQVKVDTVLEAGKDNSVYNMSFKAQNRIYQELYLVFDFSYKFTQNVPIDTVNEEVSSGLSLLYAF